MPDVLGPMRQLPAWLVAATDPMAVADALAASVPDLNEGRYHVTGVDPSRARLKDDGWTIRYGVSITNAQSSRTLRLVGTLLPPDAPGPDQPLSGAELGAPDWHCWLPDLRLALRPEPPDDGLPALPLLTDPESSRRLLEAAVTEQSRNYREFRIMSCEPKVVRYSPASRCTVTYTLEFHEADRSRGWPGLVIAKTYHGDKGQVAWDGMRALWDTPLALGSPVGVAEPLAFLPDLKVLIQGPVQEDASLDGLLAQASARNELTRAPLASAVDLAAAGLAALHGSGAPASVTLTWEDEVAEVRQVLTRLGSAIPRLAGVLDPLLDELEARAAASAPDPAVPSHGSFRPAQILLAGEGASIVDFDGFCLAEPALDIALFRSTVRDIALDELTDGDVDARDDESLRRRADEADVLCSRFLSQYRTHRAVSQSRVMLFEALDLLTVVLHSWTKVKPTRLRHGLLLLEDHLRRLREMA